MVYISWFIGLDHLKIMVGWWEKIALNPKSLFHEFENLRTSKS
jgi:hypothetical protein